MPVKFSGTPKKDPRNAKSINSMSTVSIPDTAAVLEAFLHVMPEKLSEGRIVELGDFGTLRSI